jgi:hypothetical protein
MGGNEAGIDMGMWGLDWIFPGEDLLLFDLERNAPPDRRPPGFSHVEEG